MKLIYFQGIPAYVTLFYSKWFNFGIFNLMSIKYKTHEVYQLLHHIFLIFRCDSYGMAEVTKGQRH